MIDRRDYKLFAGILLAYLWSLIVMSASEQVLTEVIPWLMGNIMPPPAAWW